MSAENSTELATHGEWKCYTVLMNANHSGDWKALQCKRLLITNKKVIRAKLFSVVWIVQSSPSTPPSHN